MNTIELVSMGAAALASATKFLGVTKDWWAKVPVLAHYVPGAMVAATVVVEKLAGVQTQDDLVNAGVALGLLVYGHFSKPSAPAAPPAA